MPQYFNSSTKSNRCWTNTAGLCGCVLPEMRIGNYLCMSLYSCVCVRLFEMIWFYRCTQKPFFLCLLRSITVLNHLPFYSTYFLFLLFVFSFYLLQLVFSCSKIYSWIFFISYQLILFQKLNINGVCSIFFFIPLICTFWIPIVARLLRWSSLVWLLCRFTFKKSNTTWKQLETCHNVYLSTISQIPFHFNVYTLFENNLR